MPKQAPATPATAPRKRRRDAAPAPQPGPEAAADRSGADLATEHENTVRRLAYDLYQARGCVDGSALEDWLQAEARVARERGRSASA